MHKKQSLICISYLNQRHIYIPTFPIKLTKFSIFPVFLTVERKYCSHNNISSCSHKYLDSLWLTLFSSKKNLCSLDLWTIFGKSVKPDVPLLVGILETSYF